MATPSLGALLGSAEWRSSGLPGTTSITTSEPIVAGDTVIVVGHFLPGGGTIRVGAPAAVIVTTGRCVAYRVYYGSTTSSSIVVTDAWCWAAFKVQDATLGTSSGFAGYSWSDGAIERGGGRTLKSIPIEPLVSETFYFGGVALDGSGAEGRFTSPGEVLNLAGYDASNPTVKYALHIFCGQTDACGAHEYELEVVGSDAADTSDYALRVAYLAADPWTGCTLAGDGSTPIALPTSHARPALLDIDLEYTLDGRRIAALCPRVAGDDFGQLWLVRYDDAIHPSPESTQVLETAGIIQCSLLRSSDGLLTIFYVRNDSAHLIRYRTSTDGGASWSAENTLDPGLAPETGLYAGTINGLGHNVNFIELASGLTVGNISLPLAGGPVFLVIERSGSGGWTYRARSTGFATQMLRPLPDGTTLRAPHIRVRDIRPDASYSTVTGASAGGTAVRGDVCPHTLRSVMTGGFTSGFTHRDGTARFCLHARCFQLDAGLGAVELGSTVHGTVLGQSQRTAAIPIGGWNQSGAVKEDRSGVATYAIDAHVMRFAPGGEIEVLACNPDLEIQFFRARSAQYSGRPVWGGKRH